MPHALTADATLECRIICRTAHQEGINVFHFRVDTLTGTPTVTDQDVAISLLGILADPYRGWMALPARVYAVGCKLIDGHGWSEELVYGEALNGTAGDVQLPTQVSGVISKKTGIMGQGYRGRLFIPFPSADYVGPDGEMNDGGQTTLTTIKDAFSNITEFNNVGGGSALVTSVLYKVASTVRVPITAFQPTFKWGTQHRRGDYGRVNI